MSATDDVTQGERNGSGAGTGTGTARIEDPARVGPRLRPRVTALGAALRGIPLRVPLVALGSWLAVRWRRLSDSSPYTDRPPAVREVVAYTRAGGWVPGDHPWWVEAPGYAYGWLVAVPVTVGLYAVSWVLQRPARLAAAVLVYALLRWAGVDALSWVPVRLDWVGVGVVDVTSWWPW